MTSFVKVLLIVLCAITFAICLGASQVCRDEAAAHGLCLGASLLSLGAFGWLISRKEVV